MLASTSLLGSETLKEEREALSLDEAFSSWFCASDGFMERKDKRLAREICEFITRLPGGVATMAQGFAQ
jgi:hypothetical protein